jgi:hypothetical protein
MQRTSTTDTWVRPLFIGGVAAAAGGFLIGSDPVSVFGMDVPPMLLIGGAAIVGELAGTAVHDMVLTRISGGNASLAATENMVLAPLLTGGFTYAAVALATGSMLSLAGGLELMAVGAGSHVAGAYAYGTVYPHTTLSPHSVGY